MKFFRDLNEIDSSKYLIATYDMESRTTLRDAAWDLAIGQSVGNPKVRNQWETEELFEHHSCLVLEEESRLETLQSGIVRIAFPIVNTNWQGDGIAHLLCQLMGGQVDIDNILRCRLIKIQIPDSVKAQFPTPKYGLTGMRAFTGNYDKPLFGAIIKPKTGIRPHVLLEMTKQLVEGGVDFIKEDEILSDPQFCSLEERVPLISNYLATQSRKVIYCFAINADPHHIRNRALFVAENGGNGVHINFWSGFGCYRTITELQQLFVHFQKSGDRVITHPKNPYGIDWSVICELAGLMGVDSIHSGMWGGYSDYTEEELKQILNILWSYNVIPALSCGMHPGLIEAITQKFGVNYMANVGGAIHGHPSGTLSGARAMRQAIDRTYGLEYSEAIQKWGVVS